MAEWLKAHAWKACMRATVSWVRIPSSPPRKILQDAIACEYKGYAREDIAAIDKKSEPRRSDELRKLRTKLYADYKQDLSRYRELACQLHKDRKVGLDDPEKPVCRDIHTNISLKHNHLFNNLAHLHYIDELLSFQNDLFG